jgi:hypothetical protein
MHHMNRVSVEIEREHFGKRDARPVNAQLKQTVGDRAGRTQHIAPQPPKRVFLHTYHCSAPSPSRIALGVSEVLGRDHHIAQSRACVALRMALIGSVLPAEGFQSVKRRPG